jgi:hypothetical protein
MRNKMSQEEGSAQYKESTMRSKEGTGTKKVNAK